MTQRERKSIRKAIELLMGDECQFIEAMEILAPMVGLRFAASDVRDAKPVSMTELAARANSTFKVRRRK